MCKFLIILITSFLLSGYLKANEPTMAILVNVISNEIQEFKIGTYKFSCTPYGIFTLEELYKTAEKDSVCRSSIKKFYKKRKNLAHYSSKILHVQQSYSLIFKAKKCIVNVRGEKSLSEILLEKGLAVKLPRKIDKEYEFYFDKAQSGAKIARRGLWEENIAKECVSSIFIKN